MTTETECPQCAGPMEYTVVGDMRDKRRECPYCGFTVDVPDAFETGRVEESVLPDGARRRVETYCRREDLTGAGGGARPAPESPPRTPMSAGGSFATGDRKQFFASLGGADDMNAAVERLAGGALGERLRDLLPDGAFESGKHSSVMSKVTESRVYSNRGAKLGPLSGPQPDQHVEWQVDNLASTPGAKPAWAGKLAVAVGLLVFLIWFVT